MTLVSGPVDLPLVPFVETRPVTTAADMFRAVRDLLPATDVLIKAAAVADYRPAQVASDKMKKSDQDLSIPPWSAPMTFWDGWRSTAIPASLSAAFPWRPGIWWPTPGPSWSERSWI